MRRSSASRVPVAMALAAGIVLSLTACVMPFSTGVGGDGDQNGTDIMFAQMMIPHHEQAVEMSELILAGQDFDPQVVALAEQIRAAQAPEIVVMEGWLDDWGIPSMGGMGGMDRDSGGGMSGFMSEDEMDELRSADGDAGSRLFLELMIEHHEGGIEMAEWVVDEGRDAEVRALAGGMITAQSAEIDTMRELLAR